MVLTGAMSELYSRESRPRLDARLWLACRLELAQALAEELNIGDIPRTYFLKSRIDHIIVRVYLCTRTT